MTFAPKPIRFERTPGIAALIVALSMIGGCHDDELLSQLVRSPSHRHLPSVPFIGDLQQNLQRASHVVESQPPTQMATLIGPKTEMVADNANRDVGQAASYLRNKEFDKALESAANAIEANPKDPSGYRLQGAAYFGKHDFARARKSFEKALSVRPDDLPSLMSLAALDVRQGDMVSARTRYQAVLAKDAKYVPAMIGMANAESASNKSSESVAWLEKAKAANPKAFSPRLALGAHYLRSNNTTAALAELTDALRSHPDNAQLLNLLGQAQMADGQKDAAIATYQKLVSLHPKSHEAHFDLAIAQINNNSFSQAAENLKKALQLKPDYLKAINALASLALRAGRPAEALKLAKDLQKVSPKSPAGMTLEGDLLMTQERYADAINAYQNALAIRQTGPLIVRLHAAYTKAGNTKEADAKLQQWLKAHPDDIGTWTYSAEENFRNGRDKLAMEQYERVLQKTPNDAKVLNNLALLYQRENDPRAIGTAEQAYKLLPDSPTVADTLGWILAEQGKTARGLELIQKAAARAPSNTEIRYHLAVVLAKSGDKGSARRELESLLASERNFPQRDAARLLLNQL